MALIDELGRIPTATIHEALGKIGALPSVLKPLDPATTMYGPAVTVATGPRDNLALHLALAEAPAGSVIIATCAGHYEAGYWGDIMAIAAQARNIAGLVIDACVRDAQEIIDMGFPVYCRGLCISGTVKKERGAVNQPIVIGDVVINPGDLVVGDRDGLVVVPKDRIAEGIEKSRAREAHEDEIKQQLRAGKTTVEILGLSM